MDTETLVKNSVEEAQKLVEGLPQRGFEVLAAFLAQGERGWQMALLHRFTGSGRCRDYQGLPVTSPGGPFDASAVLD